MLQKKICILFPEVNPISKIILLQYIQLLKPLATELWIVTKNYTLKYKEESQISFNFDSSQNKKSILLKFPMFIKMDLQMTRNLLFIRRKADFFIINHTRGMYLFPQLFAKLLGKKIILITGGTPSECTGIHPRSLFLKYFQIIINFLEKITYFLSDRVVIYSELEFKNKPGLKKYKNKVKYSGARFVNTQIFQYIIPISERGKIIGYAGRLSEEKGIRNLVASIHQINNIKTDIKFLIIGDGPLDYLIEDELVKQYSNVEYVGLVSHELLPKYLNQMKLLINPSYTEGLPKILLEAMACGTPTLFTAVGAIPDIIENGKNGFILQNNSPECITQNFIKIIGYPNLTDIVKNAKILIDEKYTFECALQRYSEIFDDL